MPQSNPAMSINNQKNLNKLFDEQLNEKFPLSDPSALEAQTQKELKVLEQHLNDLTTGIQAAIKPCGALKGKPLEKDVSQTIKKAKDALHLCFDGFYSIIKTSERSLLVALENFTQTYSSEISQWKTDFISGINRINNELIDVKFKFDETETSLADIVDNYVRYLLREEGMDPRTYPFKAAITALKSHCPKP